MIARFAFFVLLSFCFLWSFWPELASMAERWVTEEEYTHGWLVPVFALVLLYLRRSPKNDEANHESSTSEDAEPAPWPAIGTLAVGILLWVSGESASGLTLIGWAGLFVTVIGFSWFLSLIVPNGISVDLKVRTFGIVVLCFAGAIRLLSQIYNVEWIGHLSLIPFFAGLALTLGGWPSLRWSWPSLAFLFFMIPLPFRLEIALREPLRRFATTASTYVLQTIGFPAYSEGNFVKVDEIRLDVVEACSGLSMLMVFVALSVAVAILCERPNWQKLVIVVSAVPIALASNVVRITTQGLLFINGFNELAEWFHDHGAAWVMMGFALSLLWVELWYLDKLFIVEMKKPMQIGLARDPSPKLASSQPSS